MSEASLRYVIVSTQGTTRSSRTEYIRGRNSRSQYTETDGWYIDHPAWFAVHPPLRGHAIVQVAVNGKTDTPVFTDIGPRETGFPLLATRIHRSNLKDEEGNIRTYTSEDRDE